VGIIEITFYFIAFVVIFPKWPAGHGKELRGPTVARGPCVEDPLLTVSVLLSISEVACSNLGEGIEYSVVPLSSVPPQTNNEIVV